MANVITTYLRTYYNLPTYLLTHPPTYLPTYYNLLTYTPTHPPTYWFTDSRAHPHVLIIITYLPSYPPTYLLIYLFTYWPPAHQLTHPPTY